MYTYREYWLILGTDSRVISQLNWK